MINVIDHCKRNNIVAIIISCDFEKAFDMIGWSAIQRTMEHLNFENTTGMLLRH